MLPAAMAAVSVVSKIGGVISGLKSNKKKRKAARIRAQMIMMQNARQNRDLVRDFRAQRAQALVAGTYQSPMGVGGSVTQGQLSSLGSQTVGERLYIGRMAQLNQSATRAEISADRAGTMATVFNAVGDVANSYAIAKGGYDQLAAKLGKV